MNTEPTKINRSTKPMIAVVGRPNVGKSTLFNRIIQQRKAIVEDIPGVTRDRIYADAEWDGYEFSLIDTGGFDPESEELYPSLIKDQIHIAIEEADVILAVFDGEQGVMPYDADVVELLRRSEKPVIYAVNKIDHERHEQRKYDFHSLGVEDMVCISAQHGRNINDLLDEIVRRLPPYDVESEQDDEDVIGIAVLGKPNVGKSTLVNYILGEQRLITSPVPGTTRDSIDSYVERDGKKYLLIDTAGIRRKSRVSQVLEKHSVFRAVRAMERADIVLLMIDAEEGPTHQDARLATLVEDRGRGCIILLNKWDLVPQDVAKTPGIENILRDKLLAVKFAPVVIISALTGRGVNKIFPKIEEVFENFTRRIPTKKLNSFLKKLIEETPPPLYKGKEVKFYYISQPMVKQPTFVIFTNQTKAIAENYKRFIENRFRDEFELTGTPVKFLYRSERDKKR